MIQAHAPRNPRATWLPALFILALQGCSSLPDDANPGLWWRNISGGYLDERAPPPGLEEPYPNLGTVPPRPARPDPATRAAITAGLAADRGSAAQPLAPGGGARSAAARVPGLPSGNLPAAPPAPAALRPAPSVPWSTPGLDPTPPRGAAPPGSLPAAIPRGGAAPPAAPPPDLLAPPTAGPSSGPGSSGPGSSGPGFSGPPPAPPRDLLAAPPPPPPASLLAPGGGPPPAPPRDLLAPPRRD